MITAALAAVIAAQTPTPIQQGECKGRTLEEIQSAFDEKKSDFYRVFRANTLEDGQIVISFTIDEDGKMTAVQLVKSTFKSVDLAHKVVNAVYMLKFGRNECGPFTYTNYPINYFQR